MKSLLPACAILLAILSGCSGSRGVLLRVEPAGRPVLYEQRFAAAHYSVQQDGEYNLVLHNTTASPKQRKGEPLLPAAGSAPQQFMHIRVAWRPGVGAKANHPAATNAIVDWYVIDDADPHQPKYIHYQGAGLVKIYADDTDAVFDIQPLDLTVRHASGDLSDPFGNARLSGEFKAYRDSGRVNSLLMGLQETLAAGAAPATAPVVVSPSLLSMPANP